MSTLPLPDEVRLALRLPGSLHRRLQAASDAERRSLNSEIIVLLYQAVVLAEARVEAEKLLAKYGEGSSPPEC